MPTLYTASLGSVVQILQGQQFKITATDKTGNTKLDQVQTVITNVPDTGAPALPMITLNYLTSNVFLLNA
jgi:hypothetical protein